MKADIKKYIHKYKGQSVPLKKRGKNWNIDWMFNGRSIRQSLKTPNITDAKCLSETLIDKALGGKWGEIVKTKSKSGNWCTIGELIRAYREGCAALGNAESTVENYVKGLYSILYHGGLGIPEEGERRAEANKLPMSVLNSKTINKFKKYHVERAAGNLDALDSAHETINTYLRNARALFGKKVVKNKIYEGLNIGGHDDLLNCAYMPVMDKSEYHLPPQKVLSRVFGEIDTLLESLKTLRTWMCIHLVIYAGLRRNEILHARWRWFESDEKGNHFIITKTESDFKPKGGKERVIGIPSTLIGTLQEVALKHGWPLGELDYVTPKGKKAPGATKPGDGRVFGDREKGERGLKGLKKYLEERGWDRFQKAHELRKIYATQANKNSSTIDVMKSMGHDDIKTTLRYVMPQTTKPVSYDYGNETAAEG
jgi:integrase